MEKAWSRKFTKIERISKKYLSQRSDRIPSNKKISPNLNAGLDCKFIKLKLVKESFDFRKILLNELTSSKEEFYPLQANIESHLIVNKYSTIKV